MDDYFKLILLRNTQEKFKLNFPKTEKEKILNKCNFKKLTDNDKKILESFIKSDDKNILEYVKFNVEYNPKQLNKSQELNKSQKKKLQHFYKKKISSNNIQITKIELNELSSNMKIDKKKIKEYLLSIFNENDMLKSVDKKSVEDKKSVKDNKSVDNESIVDTDIKTLDDMTENERNRFINIYYEDRYYLSSLGIQSKFKLNLYNFTDIYDPETLLFVEKIKLNVRSVTAEDKLEWDIFLTNHLDENNQLDFDEITDLYIKNMKISQYYQTDSNHVYLVNKFIINSSNNQLDYILNIENTI